MLGFLGFGVVGVVTAIGVEICFVDNFTDDDDDGGGSCGGGGVGERLGGESMLSRSF